MQQQAQAATGCRPQAAAALRQSVLHVQSAFGDLLKLSPQTLFLSASGDRVQEAQMWDCFAEVYEAELAQRGRAALPEDTRRQVLADILVWAEASGGRGGMGGGVGVLEGRGVGQQGRRVQARADDSMPAGTRSGRPLCA
jgi:hypothetical protein